MLPELDRFSSIPLTEQISNSISALIESNRLGDGARLWSIRKCATTLNVSPTTVSTAYDRLVATGMVQACAAKGFFVTGPDTKAGSLAPRMPAFAAPGPHAGIRVDSAAPVNWIDAAAQHLPRDWYAERSSMTIIRKWLRALDEGSARDLEADDRELRELICIHLATNGMHVSSVDTLLADSHERALDLILSSRQYERGLVVVEDPTSARLLSFLRKRGVAMTTVRRTSRGIDIDELEAICRKRQPSLVFTQSAMHDPTGWGSTPANMHALLQLADRYGFLVAEDDTYGDFDQTGQVRLAQLSNLQQVVYYRDFSGYRWPVRNMTFIAGDSMRMKKLRAASRTAIRDQDHGVEALMAELLRSGRYARQMTRVREHLKIARANTTKFLAKAGLHVDGPGSSIFLWARIPAEIDVAALIEDAKANRIALADETAFRLPQHGSVERSRHLRFNAAFSDDIRLYGYLKKALVRFAGKN